MEMDPETGVYRCLVENLELENPCLKHREARFRLALLRFDGGVWMWVDHLDDTKGVWGIEEITLATVPEIPLHSRTAIIPLMSTLQGLGWLPHAFAEDEDLTKLIAYTEVVSKYKTGEDKCTLIAEYSQALFGKVVTSREVWDSLPKELMLLKLSEWHAAAVFLKMKEPA